MGCTTATRTAPFEVDSVSTLSLTSVIVPRTTLSTDVAEPEDAAEEAPAAGGAAESRATVPFDTSCFEQPNVHEIVMRAATAPSFVVVMKTLLSMVFQ